MLKRMVEKKEQDMRSTQRRENISTDWNHQEYGFATSHSQTTFNKFHVTSMFYYCSRDSNHATSTSVQLTSKNASSGNRTRVTPMATVYSTTRPTMLMLRWRLDCISRETDMWTVICKYQCHDIYD